MQVSPESMVLSAAAAVPTASQSPAQPGAAGASHADAGSVPGSDASPADSAYSPAAGGQHMPSSAGAHRAAGGQAGRSAGRKAADAEHHAGSKSQAGSKQHAGSKQPAQAKGARSAGGSPAKPTNQTARPGGSFSLALAQSLIVSGRGHGGHGQSADKPDTAHSQSKDLKSDPVSSTLVLVAQALSGVRRPHDAADGSAGAGSGKARAATAPALLEAAAKDAGQAAKDAGHAAKALLAHASAQDLKALSPASQSAGASPAATPVNTTPALTGAQPAVAAGSARPMHTAAHPTATLSSPVGTGAWTDELGARLTWMTHQGIESASLQLTPEHLGPLQVSISVHHGQASVWFGAAHAETRQALEQAMPQLRQMFSGQGLTLTDSGVSREPPRERTPSKGSVGAIGAVADESAEGMTGSVRTRIGLVDTYA